MSVVDLPRFPGLRGARPRFLDWGGRLEPILGSEVQTLLQPGSRFSFEFTVPSMPSEPHGRRWIAALVTGKLAGVRARFVQDGFAVGAPGHVVADGGGQSGSLLAVRGASPHYAFRAGQFFTLDHNGRGYLHMIAAQAIAGADGTAVLAIAPMLRVKPADGAVCNFGAPTIEGSLMGPEVGWDLLTEPRTEIGAIRIDEDA